MEAAESAKIQGNEEYKKGNYFRAVDFYTQAIELLPQEISYYGNRSAAYFMLHKYPEALEDCQKALDIDPNFAKVLQRAGKIHLLLGNIEQAEEFIQRASLADSTNSSILQDLKLLNDVKDNLNMVNQCTSKGGWPQAVHFLELVISQCTSAPQYKLMKLEYLIEAGRLEQGVSYSTEIMPGLQQSTEFLVLRGTCYYYLGQNQLAKKHFLEALRYDPDCNSAKQLIKKMRELDRLKQEANHLFKIKNHQAAIESYSRALEVDPKNKNYCSIIIANRAAAYMAINNHLKALEDCNKSIELNPEYVKAYLRRANVHMQLQNYEEAQRDYNFVAQKEPNTPDIDNCIRLTQDKAKRAKRKDYYAILKVDKQATDDELKKAYRKAALKWHPDKNSETPERKAEAEKKFRDIAEAYAVLTDPEKRRRYDSGMDLEDIEGGMPGGFGYGNIDPTQIFQMFFGGVGGGTDFFSRGGSFSGGENPFFSMAGPGMKFSYKRR